MLNHSLSGIYKLSTRKLGGYIEAFVIAELTSVSVENLSSFPDVFISTNLRFKSKTSNKSDNFFYLLTTKSGFLTFDKPETKSTISNRDT